MHTHSNGPAAADLAAAVASAAAHVRPYVLRTPLLPSPQLAALGGCKGVWLKLESEQATGSFKARGAVNKVLALARAGELGRGVITCSTGNHALATLHALMAVAAPPPAAAAAAADAAAAAAAAVTSTSAPPPPPPPPAHTIYLPRTASPAKLSRLRALAPAAGAALELFGDDCALAEAEARRVAARDGRPYISPYSDLEVMAGQGTLMLEVFEQLSAQQQQQHHHQQHQHGQQPPPPLLPDAVIVPVGGGGLIAGVAAAAKAHAPNCVIIGASPANSPVMELCAKAGRVLDEQPWRGTLSDATAGGVEPGALTLAPCAALVDEWRRCSEREIADALATALHHHSKLVEGAAGCALAAFKQLADEGRLRGKAVVVVVCGGNIAAAALRRVLDEGTAWGA